MRSVLPQGRSSDDGRGNVKILSHKLCDDDGTPMDFQRSPNQSGVITLEFFVMHYTAGTSAKGSVEWLSNSAARASAHLVIGRDGEVVQLVAFNRKAWHAGRSEWDGRRGVNGFSMGIELNNAGGLEGSEDRWSSCQGVGIDDAEVTVRTHAFDGVIRGWHKYSREQQHGSPVCSSASTDCVMWSVTRISLRAASPTPDPRSPWPRFVRP